MRWLSRGRRDTLGNLVLACPNHHRAIHRLDAPHDFGTGKFVFGTAVEQLRVLQHELAA